MSLQIENLAKNPRNPRKISEKKQEMLRKALHEFGDLSGIVFNRQTQTLVSGHQRQDCLTGAQVKIELVHGKPTRTGTVAEGSVIVDGERHKYREVDWDPVRAEAAGLAANQGAGEWDFGKLTETLNDLDHANFDMDLSMFDDKERDRLMGGWESDISKVEKTDEHLDGIEGKIVITCPQEMKDEVLIFIKGKFLETSFEGVHVK